MCSVMIAIEYSYKLNTKNDFNLWCELGRFLHRQSHVCAWGKISKKRWWETHITDSIQGETRIPRDMCAGNTLPGETYITVTTVTSLAPTKI